MTPQEKLALLELMTDETSETVLSAYLGLAGQIVFEKAFPFGTYPETMPAQYDGVHVEIAAYMINKRGAEGETVHLENGVSRHWEDGGVSSSLLRRIVPFAGVIFPTATPESEPEPEPEPEPDPEEGDPDETDETEP